MSKTHDVDGVFMAFGPNCDYCKTAPAQLAVSVPKLHEEPDIGVVVGETSKPIFDPKPLNVCLPCLAIEVERLMKLPPIPPVGNRA